MCGKYNVPQKSAAGIFGAQSGVDAELTQLSSVATPQSAPARNQSTGVFSTPEKVAQKPVGIVVEAPRPEIDEKAIEASPPVTCEKWIASTRSRKHESLLLDSEHADHFYHHACTNTTEVSPPIPCENGFVSVRSGPGSMRSIVNSSGQTRVGSSPQRRGTPPKLSL